MSPNKGDRPWRALFFTDSHVSFDSGAHHRRWYPTLIAGRLRAFDAWALQRLDWRSQGNLRQVLSKAAGIDVILCGGDATPGEDEEGMVSDAALEQYRRFRELVEQYWRGPVVAAWGNHDVGYHYLRPRIGGPSYESIRNAERLIGPPYQRLQVGRWTLLIVASELLAAATKSAHAPASFQQFLAARAQAQKAWIRAELEAAERVVFVDHDPRNFLQHVWPLVTAANCESKVRLTLVGHVHVRPLGMLLRLNRAARAAHLEVIPSTWQAWGLGCGYAELTLADHDLHLAVRYLSPIKIKRWWHSSHRRPAAVPPQ